MLVKRRKRFRSTRRVLVEISTVPNPLTVETAFVLSLKANDMRIETRRAWELGSDICIKQAAGEMKTKAKVVTCAPRGSSNFVLGLNILSSAKDDQDSD